MNKCEFCTASKNQNGRFVCAGWSLYDCQHGVYVPDDLDMGVLNYVYEKDIVGWMPVSDLDKIEPLL